MESYIDSLKEQMKCSLCSETLVDPKLVDCFHVFCKLCVKRNALEVDQQDYIFKCPQCDSKTLLQNLNDVEDLQNSPVHSRILKVLEFVENQKNCSVSSSHPEPLSQCVDCDKSLCDECLRLHSEFTKNHQVVSLSKSNKEDIEKLLRRETFCLTHSEQNVELYCQDCDVLICLLCLKDLHQNHKILSMHDIITVEADSLSKNIEEINKMTTDEKEKKLQEEIAITMIRDGEKAKRLVKDLTDKLVQTLWNSEQKLLNEIQESITKAERNLRIISHPLRAQEYIKFLLDNGTASEMIDTRHNKSSPNVTFQPFDKTSGGMEFKPNEELYDQIKNASLGIVQSLKKAADPKMSSINVVPSELEATKQAKLVVELKTSEGEVTQEPLENIAIQFTPEDDVKVGDVQRTDYGEVIVDFTPRAPGQLTANINLHGNPVCNSPLVMPVKPHHIREMTGPSKLKHALNTGSKNFAGIAANKPNTKIAVADRKSHCIRMFDMEGNLLQTYGSQGSGEGQLNGPHGLAFLDDIHVAIADFYNHRICIVNVVTGQLTRTFGCEGTGDGEFHYPCNVHVDADENIIVCDYNDNRVQVFTKTGDYLYQFSVPGRPYSVVTHDGLFYVSSKSAVHVIEMKGKESPSEVATIGGEDDGLVHWPYGLTIDNDTNLLICDFDAYLIHKITLEGRYVGQSCKLDQMPWYIMVLNDGQVICTTSGGGVVFMDS